MTVTTTTEKPAALAWHNQDRITYGIIFILSIIIAAAGALLPPMTGIIAPILGVPSDDWIALIVTVFLLVSGFAAIPWAFLADRSTRRNLLIVSTFFWVFWFVPILLPSISYWMLFIVYCIAAIGVGATGPLALSITIDCVPANFRSTTFGLLGTAAGAGYGFGFIISGLLVETFGWQMPFLIITLIGFATGFLLFLTREPPRGQHEECLIDLHEAGHVYTYRLNRKDLQRMWKKTSNVWLIVVGIIAIIPTAAFGAWAVRWLNVDHSLSIFVATQFMTIALASQIAGTAFFGRWGDRLFLKEKRGRSYLILLCCLFAGPILIIACFYPFAVAPSATIFDLFLNPATFVFFLLVFVGTFFDAGISPLIYVSAGDINPPEIRSTALSLHLLAHVIGVALGTQLAPTLAVISFSGTYSPALAVICIFFFLASLGTIPIIRNIRKDITTTEIETRNRIQNQSTN
ncbi:MAG: MFS transporter [Candidatus Thorarchaeota archaeon]